MREKSRNDFFDQKQEDDLNYCLSLVQEIKDQLERGSDGTNWLVPIFREWLTTIDQAGKAFNLAWMLTPGDILNLAPSLVDWAYSERFHGQVCQLLGRLSFRDIKNIIPVQVETRLDDETADWWDYWQLANLLDYLGLYSEIHELVDKAHADSDPEIQAMGDSILEDLLQVTTE